jgi:hypothetical protein
MHFQKWINKIPRAERTGVRNKMAELCDCSEITIRSYLNGNRSIPSHLFLILESFTNQYEFGGVSCRQLAMDAAARSEKHLSKAS